MKRGGPDRYPFPKRRLSQNFLTDQNIAEKIAGSLDVEEPSVIIEIGPGQGMLTRFLLTRTNHLKAVELDEILARQLPERLGNPAGLEVIQKDFLELDLNEIFQDSQNSGKYAVGNLPYHITSPVLFKILDNSEMFRQAVFMVQKEVGDRITALPGSKVYGILSVLCGLMADVRYLFTVPAHLFYPKPGVDSAVIRFDFTDERKGLLNDAALFRRIVRGTFNQRRKMLRNTLSNLFPQAIFNQVNLDLSRRPESLSVAEFISLTNQIAVSGRERDNEPDVQ